MRKFEKRLDHKGQALIEFFMFLPLILVLFTVTLTITGAINGSINQIKALRGYFYFIVKGNSKIPAPDDLKVLAGTLNMVGMYSIGWMDYQEKGSGVAVAPCYKLDKLVTEADDTCEKTDSIASNNPSISRFIRAYSVYGICTPYLFVITGADSYSEISGSQWDSGYCTRR